MSENNILSEDSTPSQAQDHLSPREHWNQLDRKGKWNYFRDYYLRKVVVIALIIGFLGYIGYITLSPKEDSKFYCMVLNDKVDASKADSFLDSFKETLSKEATDGAFTLDDTSNLSRENPDYTAQQRLSALAYTKKLVLIIAEEDTLKYIAENGYLIDITEVLPADVCKSLSKEFLFTKVEDDPVEHAYGISLKGSNQYETISTNHVYKPERNMAIGIVANSQNSETGIAFIRYLFDLN